MEGIKSIRIDSNAQSINYSGGSLDLDLSRFNTFIITLQTDLSNINISNVVIGQQYKFMFVQGSTPYSVTFPSNIVVRSGTASTIFTADSITSISFTGYNSTTIVQDGVEYTTNSEQVKQKTWAWSEGIGAPDNSYIDFVIPNVADNEIGSIESCILFVDKSLQTHNYSIVTTNSINDTIRLQADPSSESQNSEVLLYYNKAGIGIPDTSIKQEMPFTTSVPFDKPITRMFEYTVTGAINFTVNNSLAEYGNTTFVRLIADGTNIPTFDAQFNKISTSANYDNTNGKVNVIKFWFDGDGYWYEIIN